MGINDLFMEFVLIPICIPIFIVNITQHNLYYHYFLHATSTWASENNLFYNVSVSVFDKSSHLNGSKRVTTQGVGLLVSMYKHFVLNPK